MSARGSLTVTLTGAAAKDVAQLCRTDIPDFWHVARRPDFEAECDAILLVWRVAHHIKRALQQSSQDNNETHNHRRKHR